MELPPDTCQYGHRLAPGSEPIKISTEQPDGKIKVETKLLRNHVAMITGAYRTETDVDEHGFEKERQVYVGPTLTMDELSPFDPTGLVPALCDHGLPEHPDPRINEKNQGGKSWIRAKYVGFAGTSRKVVCPVCLGQARPDDLTIPANA